MGWFRRTFGFLDPGPSRYNDRPGPFGPSPSPYDPSVQWDPQGFPMGPMPRGGEMPLEYQYEANRRTEQRRQALWGDAQNTMRQGLDLLQSYRPGGAAAIASGMYGQRAGLYGQQAQTLESPDLLIDWRRDKQAKADIEARRLQRFNQVMAVGQLASNVAGALSGGGQANTQVGGPSNMPAAAIGTPMAGGQTMLGPGPGYAGGFDPGQVGQPYSGPMARSASMAPPAQMVAAPGTTPGAPDLLPGGGGGGGSPGGGGGPARRGKMGGPGGGGGPAAAGPAGGGGGPGAGGSVGSDGNFTQTALAASGASSAPWLTPALTEEWAENEGRRAKTSMMVMAATRELALAV